MKNLGIRNAIWRSRAVAIVGFLIMFFVILPGLPSALKGTLFAIFGLLTFSFGLAGSRHKSYSDAELLDNHSKNDGEMKPEISIPAIEEKIEEGIKETFSPVEEN